MAMNTGLFATNPTEGMEHKPIDFEEVKRHQAESFGNLKRAATGAVLNLTPAGDVDFLNDMRVKVANGEKISTLDKVLAASMAVPFIPAALRKGAKGTADLIKAARGSHVSIAKPQSQFDSGMSAYLRPEGMDPYDYERATSFITVADNVMTAGDKLKKSAKEIVDVARQVPEIAPHLKGRTDVQAMDIIARARDAKRAGRMGGIHTRIDGDSVIIETTDALPPQLRGKGYGSKMYMGLLGEVSNMAEQGIKFLKSDKMVSKEAARVYKSLAKRGVQVKMHPKAKFSGTHWATPDGEPVFSIRTDQPFIGEPNMNLMKGKGRD